MSRKTTAYARKRMHQPCRIIHNAGMLLLDRARPYEPGEMVAEHIRTREAFERLRTGAGDEEDFDRVSMMFNVGMIRAESIDLSLLHIMQRGQDAFVRMKDRYLRGLSFGLDADGLTTAPEALDAYEVILDASSPLQMLQAIRAAYKRISNGDLLEMPT
jgi:hypothetical protein